MKMFEQTISKGILVLVLKVWTEIFNNRWNLDINHDTLTSDTLELSIPNEHPDILSFKSLLKPSKIYIIKFR